MRDVHAALDFCMTDARRAPLERVRCFLEMTQAAHREHGYLGCLIGGPEQELSGVSEVFRRKIEGCFSEIAERLATCLDEARRVGQIPEDADPRQIANFLVDCWEAAALRCRVRQDDRPLNAIFDFYFRLAAAG